MLAVDVTHATERRVDVGLAPHELQVEVGRQLLERLRRTLHFDPKAEANRYTPSKTIPAVYIGQGGDLSLHFAAPA